MYRYSAVQQYITRCLLPGTKYCCCKVILLYNNTAVRIYIPGTLIVIFGMMTRRCETREEIYTAA